MPNFEAPYEEDPKTEEQKELGEVPTPEHLSPGEQDVKDKKFEKINREREKSYRELGEVPTLKKLPEKE